MARVVHAADLLRLTSTRDARARVDLVTVAMLGLTDIRTVHIPCHPGDIAAGHGQRDAMHLFFVRRRTAGVRSSSHRTQSVP